jgi:3-oxoadipate enol-lactonase
MIPHHVITGAEDAPTLVLSSSLGTTHRMWDPQIDALSERFRVVRYDTRGHGGSGTPRGPFSIDDAGGDVIDLLNHLGVERTHFAGLSLGGMTGMWLGIAAPLRVDRLILMCTSPKMGPADMWRDRAKTVREQGTQAIVDATLERWLTEDYRATHDLQWLREMFIGVDDEGYAGCCSIIEHMDLTTNLGQIRAPTLVIAGDDDPSTPPDWNRELADAIPDARYTLLADSRHITNVSQSRGFTDAVLGHLEGE